MAGDNWYTCSICHGRFSGVHYCMGAYPQTIDTYKLYQPIIPDTKEEIKALLKRLIELLEKMERD